LTGSHEEMKAIFKSSEKANAWVRANYDFVCKEFGKENIVRFTLHLDEKTPHIHAVVVPLTSDGRLSAKERFGNRNDLSDRQTRYADGMEQFGLKRGVVGSKAKHTSEGWYIAKQKEAEKAILNPLDRLNFLERLNPLKKIEVLTEGLKLAQNHKFDSDQKAKREEAKLLELRENYSQLKKNYDKILRSESTYKAQQDTIIDRLQKDINYEVNRLLQGRFNLHQYTPEERKQFASKMIFEVSKKQKGVNQEIYDKAMSKNDFHKNLTQAFEVRAEQNQERENKVNLNQNRGYSPGRY
ncbi:MobV family relaxase, partial [Sphingobacterium sp. Mn56C]|uniref:MobV family relaxase n=1 Tax=Sphingobacterium sp. Mn56C TaxID=3395261 RepID=UPI003BD74965